MKVYLAYSENFHNLLVEEKCRVIISYGRKHGKELVSLPEPFDDYLIDSGGFQIIAGSAERDIFIKAYTLWLEFILDKYKDKVKGYMSLDLFPKDRNNKQEIRETMEESVKNTEYMIGEGLNPIPVWKTFWPEDVLDYYCGLSQYVAIGGLVGYQGGKQALRRLFERINLRYPDNIFHMLGVGIRSTVAFRTFRPYSVDFSTWSVAVRYGHTIIPDKKQYIKEVALSDEDKLRVRKDKVFRDNLVQRMIHTCNSLATQLDYLNDPHQTHLFL